MRTQVQVWGQLLSSALGLGPLAPGGMANGGAGGSTGQAGGTGGSGPTHLGGSLPSGFEGAAGTSGSGVAGSSSVVGRPFLVHKIARVADSASRSDWLHDIALLGPGAGARRELLGARGELLGARRELLAQAWTEVALMEHASIAAFARFTLQLLSLGAPPDLVERSNAAQVDETRHARVCFAIASAYGAKSVGPGRLRINGALENTSSLLEVLVNVIEEGCIGETVAALEAAEAREHAIEPAVRKELSCISRDELRHAELAWSFVEWALRSGGEEARNAAAEAFTALARQMPEPPPVSADEATLLAGGILPANIKAALRAEAIETVILPCARRLLDRARARESGASSSVNTHFAV